MSYTLLGQDLHEVADRAKKWFATRHGAKQFKCEQPVMNDLPLRPTWRGTLRGYYICINVQPTPFSPTLHEFVNQAAQRGLPIKLWVAVPESGPKDSFASELKQARNSGVGVIQILDAGDPHEFHRAVSLSLFALARTDLKAVPKNRRDVFVEAEATFFDGAPGQGCQSICQELEAISRQFAEYAHAQGWWSSPKGSAALTAKFFTKDSWATMLETMERRANIAAIRAKSPEFQKQIVVRTRAFTDWRNDVSHKPKTLAQLKVRDAKLRTMFEATRDLLVDWYRVARPFGLIK